VAAKEVISLRIVGFGWVGESESKIRSHHDGSGDLSGNRIEDNQLGITDIE
jgi:hypothetical protein